LSENEGSEESILSAEDRKVLRDLKLMTSPYSEIAEQNLQLLAMLAESEVAEETMEDANKQLLEIIDEKEKELSTFVYTCKQKDKTLDEVSQQLLTEKGRVETLKDLYKKEVQRRKDLITSTVQESEKSIDRDLEES
jgi:hypothetical protein